jgi:virginiamycin B lyase
MTIVYSAAVKRAAIFMALLGLCAGLPGRATAAIVEFPLPNPGVNPQGITFGPDGAYWFAEISGNRIGRIDTNGNIIEYGVPTPSSGPYDIVAGPDGTNLWFTEAATSKIGRIGTNGVIQEFPLPFTITATGITAGPDGRLWVVDFGVEAEPGQRYNGGIIGVTISNGLVTQSVYYATNMTYASRPNSITPGPDGNLYFTEQLAGKIGRITTNGVITEALVADGTTQPLDITTGPDGGVWFTQANTNALGRIDPSNFTNVMEFTMPTNNTGGAIGDQLNGIALGKDGNLYYADSPAGILGRVSVNGTNLTVTQFYTPTTNALPWRVAAGTDGNVWFGEFAGNAIGKFLQSVPLTIVFTNSDVVLSWSTNVGTNFVLEENTSVNNPTNWIFVTNVPATNGSLFTVTLPTTNAAPTNSLFFRLID